MRVSEVNLEQTLCQVIQPVQQSRKPPAWTCGHFGSDATAAPLSTNRDVSREPLSRLDHGLRFSFCNTLMRRERQTRDTADIQFRPESCRCFSWTLPPTSVRSCGPYSTQNEKVRPPYVLCSLFFFVFFFFVFIFVCFV